jgi:hypothetical protein
VLPPPGSLPDGSPDEPPSSWQTQALTSKQDAIANPTRFIMASAHSMVVPDNFGRGRRQFSRLERQIAAAH